MLFFIRGLILSVLASNLGLYLAVQLVPKVEFIGSPWLFILAGSILGLANYFLKPLFNLITFPLLTFLTFGLINLIINSAIVWAVDILFPELIIVGIVPLILTSILISLTYFLLKLIKAV